VPEYKNQHYVPQHLLRGWTDNERVPVYNLENRREYPPTALSNLCSEDYFYGGSEIEESMDGLENRQAEVIQKLRSSRSFNALGTMDILYFCVFVLLQRNRTKQRKQETEQFIDNLAKEYIRLKIESGEADPELPDGRNVLDLFDDFKVSRESPLSLPMLQALTSVELIIDLEVVIIENDTDTGFIVSDHPVVHDNRRFKDDFDRFLVGIQSRGLQIFIPLSDEVQVLLYDPASYSIEYSNQEERRVTTSSENVVSGLNDVQIINALENVFYRESGQEQKMVDSQERLSEFIQDASTVFQRQTPEEHDFDTDNEIIESGFQASDYSPLLPFVRQRMSAEFGTERRQNATQQHKEYFNNILEDARAESDNT